MSHRTWLRGCLALPAVLRPLLAAAAEVGVHDGLGLFHFVTRPEIRAPKWNVTIHDQEALAPGFWFFGPYETLAQPKNSGHGWVGPHIYDQNGDLVWSGAEMFDNRNIEDFRISSVGGEDLMTLMWQERGTGVLLDNHYQTRKAVKIDSPGWFNSHEFHFVANGTRAIASTKRAIMAPAPESREIGFQGGGNCKVISDGFREYDTKTWKQTFEWTAYGPVQLTASTFNETIQNDCRGGWDYFHINSVDKTRNGDYWVSARHTDALYLVSGKDGSIIWTLGGHGVSDFKMIGDVRFARQHDVRIRAENDTHTILSILDNQKGMFDHQKPSYKFSRGLLISLHTQEPLTATIIKQIDHPHGQGSYAPRRGNYQLLDNDNIFMCWSERSLQTEHTADGRLIMEAHLVPDWLGTYRSYKFPFVGRPKEIPAVYAAAYDEEGNTTSTKVHVSWNGATEVAAWNLYKTTSDGDPKQLVNSKPRYGFETALSYEGYATYVIVEAIAADGTVLGTSDIKETIPPPDMKSAAVAAENEWLQDAQTRRVRIISHAESLLHSPIITFILGVGCSMAAITAIWVLRAKGTFGLRRRAVRYEALNERDFEAEELSHTLRKQSLDSSVE